VRNLFVNASEARLRAGWRIFLFLVLFWIFSAVIFIIKPLFGEITKSAFLSDYSLLVVSFLAVAASISVPIARKFMDKRTVISLGLKPDRRALSDLFFGFLLSGLSAGSFLWVVVELGYVNYQGISFASLDEAMPEGTGFRDWIRIFSLVSMSLFLLEHILVGYWEELVFRGYLFGNFRDGMGLILAILVSCLLYGFVHSANPNATLISTAIIVLFGFMRLYGVLLTKMLWLSMGMHIGWNFFQGPIFGFAASGHESATLVQLEILGPDWLSGGAYGPEGSVLIIPILIINLLLMYLWNRFNRKGLDPN